MASRDATRSALRRTRQGDEKPFRTTDRQDPGRITIDLYEQARPFKAACAAEGHKMADVVRELVAGWLRDHPQKS